MWWPPSWFWSRSHLDFDQGPRSAVMKRIDSFFIKCDTPKKKQCVDKQVKEDEAQRSNLQPKNPSSGEYTSDSNSYLGKVAQRFHPEWKHSHFLFLLALNSQMRFQNNTNCRSLEYWYIDILNMAYSGSDLPLVKQVQPRLGYQLMTYWLVNFKLH